MSTATDTRRARAFLQHVAEPPSPCLVRYVTEVGPVEAAHRVAERTAPADVLDECRRDVRLERADASLATAAAIGARFVIPEDDEWPTGALACLTPLAAANDRSVAPPLGLWVHGQHRLDYLAAIRSVAVVGSRAATEYGDEIAAELAYSLACRNISVWSSAAYGIDGAAHRGASLAEHPASTVAVVAYGLHADYPVGHVGLLRRIATSGAVISEYPPGTPPARHRFLVRNRLMAALTRATVVVEAGRRSSARDIARTAAALGRPVLAVPGPITSAQSAGCHDLIQDGTARLVTSADNILAAIEDDGEGATDAEAQASGCEAGRG